MSQPELSHGYRKTHFQKPILTNEKGRHVPCSKREERHTMVDALVVIQAAGER